jgi:hypothetical protein
LLFHLMIGAVRGAVATWCVLPARYRSPYRTDFSKLANV